MWDFVWSWISILHDILGSCQSVMQLPSEWTAKAEQGRF
jgi:hypothetical protein